MCAHSSQRQARLHDAMLGAPLPHPFILGGSSLSACCQLAALLLSGSEGAALPLQDVQQRLAALHNPVVGRLSLLQHSVILGLRGHLQASRIVVCSSQASEV